MPPSPEARRWLSERSAARPAKLAAGGDRFALGDYGLGLFHHDVSESAIALADDDELGEACLGSLLCFLDCARPDGCVHRIELPHKARDPEPAKPVIAQLALRVLEGLGERALKRFETERVLPRVLAFLRYLERTHVGLHGLFLTPSARASGFDSDSDHGRHARAERGGAGHQRVHGPRVPGGGGARAQNGPRGGRRAAGREGRSAPRAHGDTALPRRRARGRLRGPALEARQRAVGGRGRRPPRSGRGDAPDRVLDEPLAALRRDPLARAGRGHDPRVSSIRTATSGRPASVRSRRTAPSSTRPRG